MFKITQTLYYENAYVLGWLSSKIGLWEKWHQNNLCQEQCILCWNTGENLFKNVLFLCFALVNCNKKILFRCWFNCIISMEELNTSKSLILGRTFFRSLLAYFITHNPFRSQNIISVTRFHQHVLHMKCLLSCSVVWEMNWWMCNNKKMHTLVWHC